MNSARAGAEEILRDTIDTVYGKDPVILSELWDAAGEREYIRSARATWERIVQDFAALAGGDPPLRILEVSSFLGVVDVALSRLGFEVHAWDLPEFQENPRLKEIYETFHVTPSGGYLKEIGRSGLPYPDGHFDAVILSEVLEHLPFNPIPLLQETNRVLKPAGILYLTTPNQAALLNRLTLLSGRSVRNPVSDSLIQVDRARHAICGTHWREYTLRELEDLLKVTGFSKERHAFSINQKDLPVKRKIVVQACRLIRQLVPASGNSITIIGRKVEYRPVPLWFHEEYVKYYPR